ncbi:MAG: hypothetical protein JO035_04475 [Betaproteobacteria bacterium]|nr:hypothetical protein [Betaproteobacteria bacterium]
MRTYNVRAYNTARDSDNKIHDDAVAQRFGFTGALVPGADIYAYMMHIPIEYWGRAFLERAVSEYRFASPVYDGQNVEVAAREERDSILIEVTSQGRSCAAGSARLGTPSGLAAYQESPAPSPEHRPMASATTLAPGTVLGTQRLEASREFMTAYLRDIGETDDIYSREGLVHPGNVLRMCNYALIRNVKLGPWIHVGSKIQNLGLAHAGETLWARARVLANYEKKGHRFVELDVLVLASERSVAQVLHTAIYELRQAVRN